MPVPTVGAVLCGGASRRMGRDKALVEVDGVPLARRVADVLVAARCDRVVAVGGDGPALEALGLHVVADRWPGEGPLGGLATALAACAVGDVLVLAPCDWVAAAPEVVTRLVGALTEQAGGGVEAVGPGGLGGPVDAAHPVVAGRAQWLPSAIAVTPGRAEAVAALVTAGARRLDAVSAVVRAAPVPLAPAAVADADIPADLPSPLPDT